MLLHWRTCSHSYFRIKSSNKKVAFWADTSPASHSYIYRTLNVGTSIETSGSNPFPFAVVVCSPSVLEVPQCILNQSNYHYFSGDKPLTTTAWGDSITLYPTGCGETQSQIIVLWSPIIQSTTSPWASLWTFGGNFAELNIWDRPSILNGQISPAFYICLSVSVNLLLVKGFLQSVFYWPFDITMLNPNVLSWFHQSISCECFAPPFSVCTDMYDYPDDIYSLSERTLHSCPF